MHKIFTLFLFLIYHSTSYAVDFALPSLDGKTIQLSDYRGKWVVVNFWASWCSPCVQELPEFAEFQKQHADKTQIIGFNFEDNTAEEAKTFLQQIPPTNFPHVKDPQSQLSVDFFTTDDGKRLSLQGLPSTFFINPKGEMLGVHLGPLTATSLLTELQQYGYPKK